MSLKGIRVVEFAGLAPAPFCGKILKDLGASVIRIDKVNSPLLSPFIPFSFDCGFPCRPAAR